LDVPPENDIPIIDIKPPIELILESMALKLAFAVNLGADNVAKKYPHRVNPITPGKKIYHFLNK
jgi:hypothetical protein